MLEVFAVVGSIAIILCTIIGSMAYFEVQNQCYELTIKKQSAFNSMRFNGGYPDYPDLTKEAKEELRNGFDFNGYYDKCIRANWLVIDFPEFNPIKVREP